MPELDEFIEASFKVSLSSHLLSSMIHRWTWPWLKLGNLETKEVSEKIAAIGVDRPVYVAGLARSGSTILLEMLATHPKVVTHRYRDFPAVFTPYWWNRWLDKTPQPESGPQERAHGDGLMITRESPEAMEECLWMAFFARAHDPTASSVLDESAGYPKFEKFYREHVRKLLLVRGGTRYVSKGNYNVTRLEYLLRLFPDAKQVIPIRNPLGHVASLLKQQKLFTEGQRRHPRALAHLRQVGHYEFGLNRRAINAGDSEVVGQINDLWAAGQEVRGWARYWAHLYGWLAERLAGGGPLRQAAIVVRYEDLCEEPATQIRRVLEHCDLDGKDAIAERFAPQIHAPTYYKPQFTDDEEAIVTEETRAVAARYGYAGRDVCPEAELAR